MLGFSAACAEPASRELKTGRIEIAKTKRRMMRDETSAQGHACQEKRFIRGAMAFSLPWVSQARAAVTAFRFTQPSALFLKMFKFFLLVWH
jgi:hypothetical protein